MGDGQPERKETEQESEEERGKFLSISGCHDYACFLLPQITTNVTVNDTHLFNN